MYDEKHFQNLFVKYYLNMSVQFIVILKIKHNYKIKLMFRKKYQSYKYVKKLK